MACDKCGSSDTIEKSEEGDTFFKCNACGLTIENGVDVSKVSKPKMNSWIEQLDPVIEEFKDGDSDPLNKDEVDDLCRIIKSKINLKEGNITQEEYDKM